MSTEQADGLTAVLRSAAADGEWPPSVRKTATMVADELDGLNAAPEWDPDVE